jgi:uncharacterized protein (TIGR03000 family)
MKILTLAGLGLLLAAGSAKAQQGWPIVGSNWDTTGGGRGGYSSYSSRSYSPSYNASSYPSPSYYAAYPSVRSSYYAASPSFIGSSQPIYYGATSSEGYYSTQAAERSARVNLQVPSGARIWFDTYQTKQTGTARSFETPPMDAGQELAYQIRVQWEQDGKDVTQTRQVTVHAGDVINLTLGSSPGASKSQ